MSIGACRTFRTSDKQASRHYCVFGSTGASGSGGERRTAVVFRRAGAAVAQGLTALELIITHRAERIKNVVVLAAVPWRQRCRRARSRCSSPVVLPAILQGGFRDWRQSQSCQYPPMP